jgi:hypothetical protein
MLNSYISQVQRLLHDPNAQLYSTSDLTIYINEARTQVAVESMSVRAVLTFSTAASTQSYSLSNISSGMPTGGGYVLAVRKAAITASGVSTRIDGRPWDWFFNYCICNPAPQTGTPTTWAQLGMGAGGQIYFYPTPTAIQTITSDCVIVPVDLTSDSTPEILAYPWTIAVKFYAAYYAYMNAQRNADADRMLQLYKQVMLASAEQTTPDTLPRNFPLSSKISGVPSSTVAPFPAGGNNA